MHLLSLEDVVLLLGVILGVGFGGSLLALWGMALLSWYGSLPPRGGDERQRCGRHGESTSDLHNF